MATVMKPRTGAKGKSDDFSSSSNDLTPKATMRKPSVKELLKKIKEKDKMISSLELEIKGDLKNEQDEGARGVEVDGRGDKLCQDGQSLLSAFAFSEIQVPQGWMERNSARYEEQLLFAAHIHFVCTI